MDYLEYLTRAILEALNVKSRETLTFYRISISSFNGAVSFYLERSDLSTDHYETVLKAATVAELAGYVSAFLKGKGIDIPPAP